MRLSLKMGEKEYACDLPVGEGQVEVRRPRDRRSERGWLELTRDTLAAPVGAVKSPQEEDLTGRRVVVIVDDKARPTPAREFVPALLEALSNAGASDRDITFITASGMHDPMNRTELEEKFGAEVVASYECVPHDAGDPDAQVFVGVTDLGTPVWVNRLVVEADYTIAFGRVHPHPAYGYEGGYKMILPGVASYETIVRDHSLNFSRLSTYGVLGGPSRREAESVGRMVGIDYLVNYVVNSCGEPVAAFGGSVMEVHRRAVAYGDRYVWGVVIGEPHDVVIASPGVGGGGVDHLSVSMAALACKRGGTVVMLVDDEDHPPPQSDLHGMSLGDLLMLHEKRDFEFTRREIQWRLKAVRGEELRRRLYEESGISFVFVGGRLSERTLRLTGGKWCPTLEDAASDYLPYCDSSRILVLPEAARTLPLLRYHDA